MTSSTTRSSSRSRRPISGSSRSARSRGARIDQRPLGQSTSARRPSSNAAANCAARTGPTPGSARSSAGPAPARPDRPSRRMSASSAIVVALVWRVPLPHTRPMSSGALKPGRAPAFQSLTRSLGAGQLPDGAADRKVIHGKPPDVRRSTTGGSGSSASGSERRSPPIPPPSEPGCRLHCRQRVFTRACARLLRDFGDNSGASGPRRGCSRQGQQGEQEPVVGHVTRDRSHDAPPQEQPAECQAEGQDDRELEDGLAKPFARLFRRNPDVEDVDNREEEGAPDECGPLAQVA